MNTAKSPSALEHLLANAAWARRLAERLTGSAADGDDLIQDALLGTLENRAAPTGAVRPWLRAVIANRFRGDLRGDRRRVRRELSTELAEAPPSAEVSLNTLKLHRQLAELVAELDEPYRQTVVLRFFEDRSSAEIATLLGVPAGTVRWRLKTALDRLRSRLDERHGGDRRTWLALMVPFAGPRRGERLVPPLSAFGRAAVLMLASTLAGALLLGGWLRDLPREVEPIVADQPTAPAAAPPAVPAAAGPPTLVNAAAVADDSLDRCLRRLEELRRRERDLLLVLPLQELFQLGDRNPIAQAAMAGVIGPVMASLPQVVVGHALDCRTYACRLHLLISDRASNDDFVALHGRLDDVLDPRARGQTLERSLTGGGLARTPTALGGEKVIEEDMHLSLESLSGQVVPTSALPPGQPWTRGAVFQATSAAARPASLTACAAEAETVTARVTEAQRRWDASKPAAARYQEAQPDARLTEMVSTQMRRALSSLGLPGSPVVSCRGAICRVGQTIDGRAAPRRAVRASLDAIIERDPWFAAQTHALTEDGPTAHLLTLRSAL
jgi:RNA polymerase sigma-70 factor (ECF subfamily)